MQSADLHFETLAIHAGEEPDFRPGAYGDVAAPLHLSSTFARAKVGEPTAGLEYSRSGNPTRNALEAKLAALEGGAQALAFASGMAAETTALLALIKPGDHIVAFDDLYGGTGRLFRTLYGERVAQPSAAVQDGQPIAPSPAPTASPTRAETLVPPPRTFAGVEVTYCDASDTANVVVAIRPNTRLVWMESPTNPLLKLCDISAIADISHQAGALLVVDNTFMSPYFQRPLALGADIVVHSTTKYINGHSDSVGGSIIVGHVDNGVHEKLRFMQNAAGAILSPFDSYLVMRGLKTLALRMARHQHNALTIAWFLETSPKVKRVIYPGLKSHPQYELAKRQASGFGGMLSFELTGGLAEANRFLEALSVFALAESLGGVESLIEHPALMTHFSVPPEVRAQLGISDSLIRISAGVEHEADLLADLQCGLAAV